MKPKHDVQSPSRMSAPQRRVMADPGPAGPAAYVAVAVLTGLFLAVGLGMVRHHFLTCESANYYSEYVSTPWHFASSVTLPR